MNNGQKSQLLYDAAECSELEESLRKLSSLSEKQFETIKQEKWYVRLWDLVTFSKKGEIRLCEQISTLAQAQQIIALYLLKNSQQNKALSELVNNNATYIKKLAGKAVSFKNEITSLENLMLLLNEINTGLYNRYSPITAMCIILSQLDKSVLANERAKNNILLSLNNSKVLNGKIIEVIDFLMDIACMPEEEVSLVYTELSSIKENYYANLVFSLIEELYFKQNIISSKDDVVLNFALAHNIEKKYDSTTLNNIFVSFLNSIVEKRFPDGILTVTNPLAEQEREEAEKLFYVGKLIDAYPKFIHAADEGDARACYFAACYYNDAYGTTKKNDELYKKYLDLGIKGKDPLCILEYSKYLYNKGDKSKSEYWRKKAIPQVGKLADKGDVVACDLIARTAYYYFIVEYSSLKEKDDECYDEETKKRLKVHIGIYNTYLEKALNAGYWPTAFSKCFSIDFSLDGGDREKNIEKYGWMFENVEWATIKDGLGHHFLKIDTSENKYYKNAAACFINAYELQNEDSQCGYISFFLKAGVINETKTPVIKKEDINIYYYKGLDSDEPEILSQLGNLYFYGVGENHLGMNKSSAFEHFDRAYKKYDIKREIPSKMFDVGKRTVALYLGYMFLNGIGTERNYEKAVTHLEYAVQNGEKGAIKPLANCYLNGVGVKKDLNKYNELISMIKNE